MRGRGGGKGRGGEIERKRRREREKERDRGFIRSFRGFTHLARATLSMERGVAAIVLMSEAESDSNNWEEEVQGKNR